MNETSLHDSAAQNARDRRTNGLPTTSTADTWDRAAESYDSDRGQANLYQRCVAAAIRAVENFNPTRVLDVGCGTGLTTMPLCRSGRSVVAVDFSLASLAVLRNKSGAPPALQADLRALPFRSESFEVVLCANTLQHLPREQQVLAVRELERMVAPGGTLIISVHHYSKAKARAGWVKEGRPGEPGPIEYIFRFTVQELRQLLPEARIAAVGFRDWPWLPESMLMSVPFSVLGPFLANQGYGHMLLAVLRRPV